MAPTTLAPTTVAPAPSTSPPTTAAPTTAAPSSVSFPSFSTAGGEVYLQLVDGTQLTVYSVVRGTDWVHQVDRDGPRSVEIKFFNVVTEREAEFHAELENGRVKVES
jgi:hypothetical protein